MDEVGFAFGIAGFAVVGTDTGSATLDLVRDIIFMLFFSEVLTEFINHYREGDAFVKKFFFHHNFFQLVTMILCYKILVIGHLPFAIFHLSFDSCYWSVEIEDWRLEDKVQTHTKFHLQYFTISFLITVCTSSA